MFSIICYITILFIVNLKCYEAKYGDICMTPDNNAGQCVPIRSCSNILNKLLLDLDNVPAADANFLRLSSCGRFNNVYHVCCSNENITLNTKGFEILNNADCGYFQIPRVAHGQEARLFTFPWMALLKYDDVRPFKCGATLISHRYVLTAAHCVNDRSLLPIEVRLGEHNITSAVDCQKFGRQVLCAPPVEDVGIEEIIIHPNYNTLQNDIALIRLNRSVDFKDHIRAICLPISEELRTNYPEQYFVSGWGHTENGTTSDVLKFAVIPHKDLSVCLDIFRRINLTPGHICAGGEEMHDSCRGDSGGPISQISTYKGRLRLIQYGIVSFGIKTCGIKSVPAIYTNVGNYMQWITDTIRDDTATDVGDK